MGPIVGTAGGRSDTVPTVNPTTTTPNNGGASATEEHPHVVTYRRMISAFNSNDLGVVQEVVATDLEYILPGRSVLAGVTHGVDAHLAMLKRARELTMGTLHLEPQALATNGDYLFVWGTISAARGERRLRCEHCVVYRFSAGKIVAGRTVPTDLYAFDEFWSEVGQESI